jgi:hypothetical protein
MSLHKNLTLTDLHALYTWSYANAAARTGATGFASADVGKMAWQTDNDSFWILKAATPTWVPIQGTGAGLGDMLAAVYDPTSVAGDCFDTDNHVDGTTNHVFTAADDTKLGNIEASADVTDATNVNAAGAVMESDYNAQTILAATSDDTPAALTVGEQTVVGRITGGNIAALSVAQLQALLFGTALGTEILLGENYGIKYDAALSADGKYAGFVRSGTAGATLAFGDLIYLAAADSRWELVDANAASTSGDVLLGICVQAAANDGDATTVLMHGFVRADTAFPALTISAPAYASTTAGDIQTAQPSGTDDVIRRVGFAWTADELYFCPSPDYATHT